MPRDLAALIQRGVGAARSRRCIISGNLLLAGVSDTVALLLGRETGCTLPPGCPPPQKVGMKVTKYLQYKAFVIMEQVIGYQLLSATRQEIAAFKDRFLIEVSTLNMSAFGGILLQNDFERSATKF